VSGEVEELHGRPAGSSERSGFEDETAVVSSAAELARPRSVGSLLGRYVVLEEIGRGGMGRVVRAYDPKLQREVALKEVRRVSLGEDHRARLVAEARAMAQLSHPNVVAVYDVEEDDDVVLVMEYVAGQTLADWVQSDAWSWKDIVDRYVAAGRGLAAAHAVGLMHRDFKPRNVLVSQDGVVKVTDFGLAKLGGTSSLGESLVAHGGTSSLGSEGLTAVGVVMGTPRYMAPEQHCKEAILTVAADQYAFCVALWEALCGEAPFRGKDLARAKHQGPPPWPGGRGRSGETPRRVVEALRRGLSVAPAHRWPSMEALLDVLSREPGRGRASWLMVGAGVVTLGIGAASLHAWAQARAQRCTGAEAQLAGVWDDDRRSAVQAAVIGVGKTYATHVWERTEAELDRYAAEWVAMHTEACEATTVRGEQSSAVMDARMACLHRAKVELQAVTAVLASADAEVVNKAHEVLGALRPLPRCADVTALQAEVEPPSDAEAAAVELAGVQLAASRAAVQAGKYDDASAQVEAAQESLGGVGYGPVRTELALARAAVLDHAGEYTEAEAAYEEALGLAGEHRQWAEMFDASRWLLYLVGYKQQRPEGLRYLSLARGLARGEPEREGSVHNNLGAILYAQGKYAEGEAEFRRALALWEQAVGAETPRVAGARNNLGAILRAQGKYAEAEAEHRRALAVWKKMLGPEHPDVAMSHNNLGVILQVQDKLEEAEVEHRRALMLWTRALGAEHPYVAMSHNNLGGTLYAQAKYEEAEAEYRPALAAWENALGAEHPHVATAQTNLAEVLLDRGAVDEARALAEQSWARRQREDIPRVQRAETAFVLARVLRATGEPTELERARVLAQQALDAHLEEGEASSKAALEVREWLERSADR
jgi:eukaryotic-like serine/threonine-protein kinase